MLVVEKAMKMKKREKLHTQQADPTALLGTTLLENFIDHRS